jgi:plant cysteine oxidase
VRGDPIGYHHVFSDSLLSIGIFVLPEGAVIPLHDHPNMTVLSKLIYGSLQVTSYDMPTDAPRKLSA